VRINIDTFFLIPKLLFHWNVMSIVINTFRIFSIYVTINILFGNLNFLTRYTHCFRFV